MNIAQGIAAVLLLIALFVLALDANKSDQAGKAMTSFALLVLGALLMLDGLIFLLRYVNWSALFKG